MYDFHRSENYDVDNCKHLACTEVRGALFDSLCNPKQREQLSNLPSMTGDARVETNEFCIRDKAVSHLMERAKCADKAERYVDYVFNKCKNDSAPFSKGNQRSVKKLTDIL